MLNSSLVFKNACQYCEKPSFHAVLLVVFRHANEIQFKCRLNMGRRHPPALYDVFFSLMYSNTSSDIFERSSWIRCFRFKAEPPIDFVAERPANPRRLRTYELDKWTTFCDAAAWSGVGFSRRLAKLATCCCSSLSINMLTSS